MGGSLTRVATAFAVASLVLAGCAEKHTDSPRFPDGPVFQEIHMVTPNDGWALASQGLLRTRDGGLTWQAVTPPGVQNTARVNWFVLDGDTAWLLVSDNGRGILFHTADGGKQWDKGEVPFKRATLFFHRVGDQSRGWALKDYGAASGNHPVDLYEMGSDPAWVLVHQGEGPHNPAARPGSLPYPGTKTGLVFQPDGRTGWVTVERREPEEYGFYRTTDGGETWTRQALPVPCGLEGNVIHMTAPRFFPGTQAKNGVLPLVFQKGSDYVAVFFATQDGGATWKATAPFPAGGQKPLITMADATNWWVLSDSRLHATRDGGATWTEVGRLAGAVQLQFVGPARGWALARADSGIILLRTTDGGQTWIELPGWMVSATG